MTHQSTSYLQYNWHFSPNNSRRHFVEMASHDLLKGTVPLSFIILSRDFIRSSLEPTHGYAAAVTPNEWGSLLASHLEPGLAYTSTRFYSLCTKCEGSMSVVLICTGVPQYWVKYIKINSIFICRVTKTSIHARGLARVSIIPRVYNGF